MSGDAPAQTTPAGSGRARAGGRRRPPGPPIVRHAFVAILVVWLVMPVALGGRVAQDAVPYVTAGRIATSQPAEVYAARNGDLFDLRPAFRERWCAVAPPGTDCDDVAVAFVAAPPVIPLAVALTVFGDRGGALVMQFAAAAMLAGGMWILWRRLAHRTKHAPHLLLATAVLATPMAMGPIGLGQTSPVLFLSVVLGMGLRARRGPAGRAGVRSVTAAAAWAAAVALKVFPAALGALVVWRRRWPLLAWAAGVLTVLSVVTLVIVDPSVWSDFVRVTLELDAHTATNPYNGAVNAFLVRLFGSPEAGMVTVAARLIALAAGVAVCWSAMRGTDDDTRWAAGYVALLLVTPLVWWHYTWVVLGAIGVAVAAQPKLDDRLVAALPLAAAVSVAPSIPNANGHSWPEVQAVLLVVGAGAFCVLARRAAAERTKAAAAAPVSSGAG